MTDFAIIRSFIEKRWKAFLVGSVFVVVTNILDVFIPSYVGKAIDIIRSHFAFSDLYRVVGLIFVIQTVKGITRFFMRYIIIGASWKAENDVRKRLFNHLLRLPLPFYNSSRTGDLIARLTNDLTAVRMMIGPAVMYTMNALVLLPAALVFMFAKDVQLTLYALIPFPFLAFLINRVGRRIHTGFTRVQESYSDISAHIQENLNGIQVVKAYVLEQKELEKLRELSEGYVKNNRYIIRLQSIMWPLLDIFSSLGLILVLWIGAHKVISGQTSLGTIVAFILYIGLLAWPAIALGWVVAIFQRGTASARRIQEILDVEQERPDADPDTTPLHGAVSVQNLHFSYNGDREAIESVSFEVKPGGTLAIVGRTGSGKSTLLNLLTGTFSIPRGIIFYDGMDINDISLTRLRSSIAYVPQETFLFSETVAENIAFGKEGADMESIKNAARLAAIDEEIAAYPAGYYTVIGERGITVSGGQRQRIAIARAFISDAPILFLDDSLSSVDTVTEMTILRNVHDVIRNKTAIIITQRLGAIRNADEILYMSDGKIIERGTHESLMRLNGEYAALYNEQEAIESLDPADPETSSG
ncbi:MAG: ABC transporter ATP-binding protein [Candidatus Latescibacter sp.]|nr:ABC transporter ATP-binding protein [Candidatus Latescibacter sp.]